MPSPTLHLSLALLLVACQRTPDTASTGTPDKPSLAVASNAAPSTTPSATPANQQADFLAQRCSIAGAVHAKQLAPALFQLERSALHEAISQIAAHMKSPSKNPLAVASRSTDGRTGLRLMGVASKAACGFKPLDVVLAVDQIPVDDTAALQAHQDQWRTASRIEVDIEREGVRSVLTFQIVN